MKIFYVAGGVFPAVCCSLKSVKDAAPWLATFVTENGRKKDRERERWGKKEGEVPAGQLIRRR